MKSIVSSIIIVFLLSLSMIAFSQEINIIEKTKKVGNVTYKIIEKGNHIKIYNSENKFSEKPVFNKIFDFKSNVPLAKLYKKVFSDERIKELKSKHNVLSMSFYVNNDGDVLEMTFRTKYAPNISLEELKKLEQVMKANKFVIKSIEDEGLYYFAIMLCFDML
jgi:hypothetical protein